MSYPPLLPQVGHSVQTRCEILRKSRESRESCTWLMLQISFDDVQPIHSHVKHHTWNMTIIQHTSTQYSQLFNFHLLSRNLASRIRRCAPAASLSLSMVFWCSSLAPHSLKHCMSPNISWFYLFQWVISPLKSLCLWMKSTHCSQYLWLR